MDMWTPPDCEREAPDGELLVRFYGPAACQALPEMEMLRAAYVWFGILGLPNVLRNGIILHL